MIVLLAAFLATAGCNRQPQTPGPAEDMRMSDADAEKIRKSEDEWRHCLSPEQYDVMRRKGTERAFTGEYWNYKGDGTFTCAGCGQPLFDAATKFDSGTGWPSFWAPIAPGSVATEEDRALGMRRVEVLCSRCDAHLGHVFDDGPNPTGLRYCINSAALKLEEEEKE